MITLTACSNSYTGYLTGLRSHVAKTLGSWAVFET